VGGELIKERNYGGGGVMWKSKRVDFHMNIEWATVIPTMEHHLNLEFAPHPKECLRAHGDCIELSESTSLEHP